MHNLHASAYRLFHIVLVGSRGLGHSYLMFRPRFTLLELLEYVRDCFVLARAFR